MYLETFARYVNVQGHAVTIGRLVELGVMALTKNTEPQCRQIVAEIANGIPLGTSVEKVEEAVEKKLAKLQDKHDKALAELKEHKAKDAVDEAALVEALARAEAAEARAADLEAQLQTLQTRLEPVVAETAKP